MQIFRIGIYSLFLVMLAFSCGDEPLPDDPFVAPETSVYATELSNDGVDYLISDPNSSTFTFEVEYYSENDGEDIKAHEWFVSHRDRATGAISSPELIDSVPSSSFDINADSGLPTYTFTFDLNDALAKMGKTIDDVNGGDDIIYDGFIVMNDGRRFGPDSTGVSFQNGEAIDGVFRIVKPLFCPSDLAGTYASSVTGVSTDSCCILDTIVLDTVVLERDTSNLRTYTISDYTANLYLVWYGSEGGNYGIDQAFIDGGGMNGNLIDACGIISSSTTIGPFGETVEITGMVVNMEDGIIEYDLINGYGDKITVVLTRQ